MATIDKISTPKIGYIDSSILLQKYDGAVEARQKLEKETSEWRENIQTLEKELNDMNQDMIKKGATWSRSALKKKKEALEKKQQDYVRYSRAVSEKAAKREQELMQEIFDELNALIKDFGKEQGYDIIWGTVAGGNILYGREGRNLTEQFLDYIKDKE
jgi:outer membrane protein